jgi:hypothetical protein
MTTFWVESSIILCELPKNFPHQLKINIIYNFVIFVATRIGRTTNFFHPSLLLLFLDPGSGMDKNQDPGSGINIPDTQHREQLFFFFLLLKCSLLHKKRLAEGACWELAAA